MSAFIVSKAHIDALVTAGYDQRREGMSFRRLDGSNGRIPLDATNVDTLGQMLTDAIVASVSYRYPDDMPDELPGPTDHWWLEAYELPTNLIAPIRMGGPPPTTIEVLKLISCYEYQACERPDWEESAARDYCDYLRRVLVTRLPGYAEAAWELN